MVRQDTAKQAFQRGLVAGLGVDALVLAAALPARVVRIALPGGALRARVEQVVAGTLIDAAAGAAFVVPAALFVALLVPLLLAKARDARWQRSGALLSTGPFVVALWATLVSAHETHRERGAFPTLFDVREAESAAFLHGALGFLAY